MTKRKVTNADEYDLVSGWRRVLCYMQRAGVTSGIKRRMRRRERRQGRTAIRRGDDS